MNDQEVLHPVLQRRQRGLANVSNGQVAVVAPGLRPVGDSKSASVVDVAVYVPAHAERLAGFHGEQVDTVGIFAARDTGPIIGRRRVTAAISTGCEGRQDEHRTHPRNVFQPHRHAVNPGKSEACHRTSKRKHLIMWIAVDLTVRVPSENSSPFPLPLQGFLGSLGFSWEPGSDGILEVEGSIPFGSTNFTFESAELQTRRFQLPLCCPWPARDRPPTSASTASRRTAGDKWA